MTIRVILTTISCFRFQLSVSSFSTHGGHVIARVHCTDYKIIDRSYLTACGFVYPRTKHVFQCMQEKLGRSGRFGNVVMMYLPPLLQIQAPI